MRLPCPASRHQCPTRRQTAPGGADPTLLEGIALGFLCLLATCLSAQVLPAGEPAAPEATTSAPEATTSAKSERSLPPEAREDLHYTLGLWRSPQRTIFGRDGQVERTVADGGFVEEVLIENHLNLHSSYAPDGKINKGFRFYSPAEDRMYLIDVTFGGRWWVLSGKPGDDMMVSHEKVLEDGRKVMLKFTHTNIREDAFEAVHEVSFDGGKTWAKRSHTEYRRVGGQPAGG